MEDSKQWYQSKTIWAALVTVVIGTLGIFGIGSYDAEKDSIVEVIMQIVTAVSGIIAIIGRIVATKKIGSPSEGISPLWLLPIALCLMLAGCAGQAARQNTLLPVIGQQWTELKPYADPNDVAAMDAAVAAGDKLELSARWQITRPDIMTNINQKADDHTLPLSVAASLLECIKQTDATITTYSGP